MRNTAEDCVGQHLIASGVIRKELCGVVEAHFFHLIDAGSSAVQRVFLRQQFLLNEAHRAAAEDNHYVAILQFRIPEVLQN